MSEKISIKQYKENGYSVMMNPEKALALGINRSRTVCISYGTQKCYAYIKLSAEAGQDDIYLSQKIIDYLHIPEYPDFEMRYRGSEIMLGPHIGILIDKEDGNITEIKLKSALKFVSRYSMLNGSIIVFALDKVDQSKRLIEGYCYNPGQNSWERGIFPYPLSIYLWIIPSRSWKNHFLSVLGNTIFNSFYLNKYELYLSLSTDPYMKDHLAKTILYRSSQDVFDMMEKFGKVIVKPIAGFKGIGVTRINYEGNKAAVRYRKDDMNAEEFYENDKELRERFNVLFVPDKYIVQQHIDLLTYENGVIDFRLVMQKDDRGEWVCKTIIGRIGDCNSIVSNISNGARAMIAADVFKDILNLPQAEEMERMLLETGFKICDRLCNLGINYGNLGLDVGIDTNMHPWLIEVNSRRPDNRVAMRINDKELYLDICSGPLLYAKFLAGFKPSP